MQLPSIQELGFSSVAWLILGYIIAMGSYQFYKIKIRSESLKKTFVPLGYVAFIFTLLAYFSGIKEAFEAIKSRIGSWRHLTILQSPVSRVNHTGRIIYF